MYERLYDKKPSGAACVHPMLVGVGVRVGMGLRLGLQPAVRASHSRIAGRAQYGKGRGVVVKSVGRRGAKVVDPGCSL